MNKKKNILIIIVLCLPQTSCLVAAAVEGVTDVAISVAKIPVKVGGAVVDVVTGDEGKD